MVCVCGWLQTVLQSISYHRACVELLTLNITGPTLSNEFETCDREAVNQLRGMGEGSQERKDCLHVKKVKANNSL